MGAVWTTTAGTTWTKRRNEIAARIRARRERLAAEASAAAAEAFDEVGLLEPESPRGRIARVCRAVKWTRQRIEAEGVNQGRT